jgi:DNA-binding transcriptional ArsR family regulator
MSLFGDMIPKADDRVWKALADPTRRAILDLLHERPRTTGEICSRFRSLSRTAVLKHLGILGRAHLVLSRSDGRFRWNHLNPAPIRQIHDRWLSRHAARLAQTALELKRHVESQRLARGD